MMPPNREDFEGKHFAQLMDAPIEALTVLTAVQMAALRNMFGIHTIGEMAKHAAVQQALEILRQAEIEAKLMAATDALVHEYTHNEELTAFQVLDSEGFYEAR